MHVFYITDYGFYGNAPVDRYTAMHAVASLRYYTQSERCEQQIDEQSVLSSDAQSTDNNILRYFMPICAAKQYICYCTVTLFIAHELYEDFFVGSHVCGTRWNGCVSKSVMRTSKMSVNLSHAWFLHDQ